jgi:hypothetical protein
MTDREAEQIYGVTRYTIRDILRKKGIVRGTYRGVWNVSHNDMCIVCNDLKADHPARQICDHISEKILIRDTEQIPGTYIPYQNIWGLWVWRDPHMIEKKSWPGIKAPSHNYKPLYLSGKWYWSQSK